MTEIVNRKGNGIEDHVDEFIGFAGCLGCFFIMVFILGMALPIAYAFYRLF